MIRTRVLILSFLIVFAPSLLIRLHPVTSESFTHDAIVSQMAAARGIAANALDGGDAFLLRRAHPPLLSYIITVNNAVFGGDEFRARLFSILAGALSCLVVSISIYSAVGRSKAAAIGGVLGGWLICLLPVHLYISRSANWDAVYSLFHICSLLFLSLHLTNPRFRMLAWAGVFAVFTFLTCELGVSLLPAFIVTFVFDLRGRKRADVLREWGGMVLLALVLATMLWPAGVFKLNLLRTLRYRLYDSAVGERNLPWHGFFTTLFDQSPAYSIITIAGILTAIFLLSANRRKSEARPIGDNGFLVRLLPFGAYALTALLLSFKQRLVYIHHIADLFPSLTVVAMSAFAATARSMTPNVGRAVAALGIFVVILSGVSALNPDPDIVGPQEHAGYLGIRDFLKDYPNARTFYYYDYAMEYYLPGAEIVSSLPRTWTKEKLDTAKAGDFDFIICDTTTLDTAFPSVDVIADVLYPEYELAHTVYHRRTDEPVAWIFGRR